MMTTPRPRPIVDEAPEDRLPLAAFGQIEMDILTYLEMHGTTTLRQLLAALSWPAPLVTMAVGALIRQSQILGMQRHPEIVLSR